MELLEMRVSRACAVATSSNLNRTARDFSNCRRSGAPKSQRVIYRILPGSISERFIGTGAITGIVADSGSSPCRYSAGENSLSAISSLSAVLNPQS